MNKNKWKKIKIKIKNEQASQIIMLYTSNLHSAVWELHFNKTGRKSAYQRNIVAGSC